MAQATLDDDDLFGEAAGELREDVETHLEAAWTALPAADDVWRAEADNVLGVLNTLRTSLDSEDAGEHLRAARKWYTVGERAGAFDSDGDLAESIEQLSETLDRIDRVKEDVGEVASTLPALRETLAASGGDPEDEGGDDD